MATLETMKTKKGNYSIYQENPKEALNILKNIIHLNSTKDCLEYFKPIEKDINFDLQAYKKSLKL